MDQLSYWDQSPIVFIARIEAYVSPSSREAVRLRDEEVRRSGKATPLVVNARRLQSHAHKIRIVPLAWLKGSPKPLNPFYVVSWPPVGCAPNPDRIWAAQHGDTVIVYAYSTFTVQDGKAIEDGLGFFGIAADQAADPQLIEALSR